MVHILTERNDFVRYEPLTYTSNLITCSPWLRTEQIQMQDLRSKSSGGTEIFILYFLFVYLFWPSFTIKAPPNACNMLRNILQHSCLHTMWYHAARCWMVLDQVSKCSKFFRNILKLKMLCVFGQLLHNVARCCIEMLRALDRTLRFIHNLAI